jgi:hypothetical protein
MKNWIVAGAACLVLAQPAIASEGDVYGGPIGGTDIRNAYLPPPGLYGGVVAIGAYAFQLNGDNGKKNPALHNVDLNLGGVAAGAEYVYTPTFYGGRLATEVQEGYYAPATLSIDHHREYGGGWTDLYSDLLKWSRYLGPMGVTVPPGARKLPYGLTVQAAYSMIFPIGAYRSNVFASSGHNTYFVIPNFAATYLTAPNFAGDGAEISAHLFFDHAFENPTTNYVSGDVVDIDYALSERTGRFQYGLNGYYATQVNNDSKNGILVQPDGKHYVAMKIGPIIAYDIPRLGMTVKFKATFPVIIHNAIAGPAAALEVGFKF